MPEQAPPGTNSALESESVVQVIEARRHDVLGVSVQRALPTRQRRRVGPFTFLDHMGPAQFQPGNGMDVGPHPHIGLATLTFLFEGEALHRDSLGSEQTIRPGDVNWMFAGNGIVHSERSTPEARQRGMRLHGIQSWLALPSEREADEPYFEHHPASTMPKLSLPGAELDVIAGTAFGLQAPTSVCSETLYVHARLDAGAKLPLDAEHAERAVYVVEGSLRLDGRDFGPGTLVVLRAGANVELQASGVARWMLVGGAPLVGQRYLLWNFVASDPQRLEQAKSDWMQGRFALVPGDEHERVPMPA
jgi:redox-sensitive bicupin YhaK (pirin superfamily)